MTDLVIRTAVPEDAPALHALIGAHQQEGHLLPREVTELRRRAPRFVVAEAGGRLLACAELARLSGRVAEIRSLVVARDARRVGLGARIVGELRERALAAGFESLCAFTHDARLFVRHDFSLVPHLWLPEKIATDCVDCPLFGTCGQQAMVLPLRAASRAAAVRRAVA